VLFLSTALGPGIGYSTLGAAGSNPSLALGGDGGGVGVKADAFAFSCIGDGLRIGGSKDRASGLSLLNFLYRFPLSSGVVSFSFKKVWKLAYVVCY